MPGAKQDDIERIRKSILIDYQSGKKPKELSNQYGININTVKSWIKRSAAKEGADTKSGAKKRVQKIAPGAPAGNADTTGNKGVGAPVGNTNAMKHGGYSPVYWDTLTEEEQQLIQNTEYDGEQLLLDEIALLSIRERRIMANIRKHSEIKSGQVIAGIVRSETKREFNNDAERELYETVQRQKVKDGKILPGRSYQLSTRTEATYEIVHRLEDALSRCQAQKQKCIQSLNDLRAAKRDDEKGDIIYRMEIEDMDDIERDIYGDC